MANTIDINTSTPREVNITGKWTWHDYYNVTYSWTDPPSYGVVLPTTIKKLKSGDVVAVDTKYTSNSTIDAINNDWTRGTISNTSRFWWSVCYGNGKYVAIANESNYFAYSTDGINWTESTISSTSRKWWSVCYGNGKFVAVTYQSNYFAYSTDGITWTEGTISDANRQWRSVCYGNGKFVAIAQNSNYFAYSTDGITWTENTISSTSRQWNSVCYGNGKFVAIAYNSRYFAYSTDGINWTEDTISSTSRRWRSMCYDNGKFVVVAFNSNYYAYSTDGINWTEGTISSTSRDWYSVCYGNGKYVAVANNTNYFAYSTDGINWTEGIISGTSIGWESVCYGNGKFVAIADRSSYFAYSTLLDLDYYYQFSGWNRSGNITINSNVSITGSWTQQNYLSVTYNWTNAPSGVSLPSSKTKLKSGTVVAVDTTYTSNTKVINNSGSYKFSGWNKSGNITVTSNVNISGNWIGGSWSSLSLGSTFLLGKYQVGSETPWDIEWEIVHQESNYQIAMAKQILDLRCFDAMEPSNSDSGRKNYGNHNWQYSNIEQWLNSDQSNWYSAQHSADAPPSSANVYSNYNPYDTKPGFLYYWTDEEKAVLQNMALTLANNKVTDGGGSYTWTGKVWLPTYTQISGKQNNSISEGTQFSKFTDNASRVKTLHAMCAANNQYCIDNGYAEGKALYYWMSSAHPSNSYYSRFVDSNGYPDTATSAYNGQTGLAPCIRVPR